MKPLALLCLFLPGCAFQSGPDMGPVGAGLSVIGLGIIVAALVLTLFRGGGQ
jgi:hypothetical protein